MNIEFDNVESVDLSVGATHVNPGTIMLSVDGGEFVKVWPTSVGEAYFVSRFGIFKYTEGSLRQLYEAPSTFSSSEYNGIAATSSGLLVFVDGKTIYVSNDYGKTWSRNTVSTNYQYPVAYSGEVYAVVSNSGLFKTSDGFTWTRVTNRYTSRRPFVCNGKLIVQCGSAFDIFDGVSWKYVECKSSLGLSSITSMCYYANDDSYVFLQGGHICYTYDFTTYFYANGDSSVYATGSSLEYVKSVDSIVVYGHAVDLSSDYSAAYKYNYETGEFSRLIVIQGAARFMLETKGSLLLASENQLRRYQPSKLIESTKFYFGCVIVR